MAIFRTLFARLAREEPPPYRPPAPPDGRRASSVFLEDIFRDCADLQRREVRPGGGRCGTLALFWLDGLVNAEALSEEVLRPLTEKARLAGAEDEGEVFRRLARGGIFACTLQTATDMAALTEALLRGCCALVFDRLSPHLDADETEWLRVHTQPLESAI